MVRLLDEHALTSPGPDRQLGAPARQDRARRGLAQAVHERHRGLRRARRSRRSTRRSRTCGSRARSLGPCPVCGHEIVENRKGYSCWAREDPGCGFVIWKAKAGKQLPVAIARELIKTGYTARPVTGFRGRSGRSFRAHLALSQTEEGKWRVEFDEAVGARGRQAARGRGRGEAAEAGRERSSAPPSRQRRLSRSAGASGRCARMADVMPITLVTGPANAGKAQLVMDAVRAPSRPRRGAAARRADPRRRRALPARAGRRRRRARACASSASRALLEELVRRAGVREPALGGLARERLIAALGDGARGERLRPGFVRALGELFAELQVARVDAGAAARGARARSAADGAGGPRARARAAVRPTTRRAGAAGPPRRRAARRARARRAARAPGAVGRARRCCSTASTTSPRCSSTRSRRSAGSSTPRSRCRSPTSPAASRSPGARGTFQALAPLARRAPRAGGARRALRAARARGARATSSARCSSRAPRASTRATRCALLEGGGERAELELVAREVAALLARGHGAPRRSPSSCAPRRRRARLVEEVFARGRRPVRAAAPAAVRRHRDRAGADRAAALPPRPGGGPAGDAGDLLAWLRAPGLLERPELADRSSATLRRRGLRERRAARALWEEQHWPLDALDRLRGGRGARARRARSSARGASCSGCSPRRGAARAPCSTPASSTRRARWPPGARALERAARARARSTPARARDGGRAGRGRSSGVEVVGGERPAPGAVAVLDPLALRARRVRALFVCGLQEGVFPRAARPQPLLGEEERGAARRGLGAAPRRARGRARGRALPALRGRLATRGAARAELARRRRRRRAARALAVRRRRLRPVRRAPRRAARARRALGRRSTRGRRRRRAAATAAARSRAPLRDERVLGALRGRSGRPPRSRAGSAARCAGSSSACSRRRLDPEPEPLARGGLAHAALNDTLEGLRARPARRASDARDPGARARAAARARWRATRPSYPLSVAPERRPACAGGCAPTWSATSSTRPTREQRRSSRRTGARLRLRRGAERGEPSELPALELGAGVAAARAHRPRRRRARAARRWSTTTRAATRRRPAKWVAERQAAGRALHARRGGAARAARGGRPLPAAARRGPARARAARRRQRRRARLRANATAASTRSCDELIDEALARRAREAAAQAARGRARGRGRRRCALRRAAASSRRSADASAERVEQRALETTGRARRGSARPVADR